GIYCCFDCPDDSALVERVFHDNLPFARALIVAAGDLRLSPGVTGARPSVPRFMSLWPESRLGLETSAPRPMLTLRTNTGAPLTRRSPTDSLPRGRLRTV